MIGFYAGVGLLFGPAMPPAAGAIGSLFAIVFSRGVSYTGASVGYTRPQIVGPAFAPTIATALFAAYGSSDAIVIYLVIVALISCICVDC